MKVVPKGKKNVRLRSPAVFRSREEICIIVSIIDDGDGGGNDGLLPSLRHAILAPLVSTSGLTRSEALKASSLFQLPVNGSWGNVSRHRVNTVRPVIEPHRLLDGLGPVAWTSVL